MGILRRPHLFLGFLFSTLPVALDATTIVILHGEGQLILAADSKRRYAQGGETLFEATACKLLVLGDMVFTASGSTALAGADGQSLFDVRALAGRMLSQPGRIIERVRRFDDALVGELDRVRPVFDERQTTGLFLEVALAGVTNGRPVLFIRRFEVSADAEGRLAARRIVRRSCDECRSMIEVLGHDDGIVDLLEGTTTAERRRMAQSLETARTFIRAEIAQTPDWAGPPIDVLRLDRWGIHWEGRKPECDGGR